MNRKLFSAVLIFSLFLNVFSACRGKSSAEKSCEVEVYLTGGSGRAKLVSPAKALYKNDKTFVQLVFTSSSYDYVIASGKKYLNENPGKNSTFSVPVKNFSDSFEILASTTAMSIPHEIKYTVNFGKEISSSGMLDEGNDVPETLKPVPLTKTGEVPVKYSHLLKIEKYGNYSLASISGSGRFLIVPAGKEKPENLPSDVVCLFKPLDKTYLVSTSAMDFVSKLDAVEMLRFSGLKEKDWTIEKAREAMKKGSLLYAGKYSIPDYEKLYAEGCSLAVENTMVLHSPEVKEKLTELGIPVLIERSTYEKNPLGRLEWIKLYGTLFDREDEAVEFFEDSLKKVQRVLINEATGKTVSFFYVTTGGAVNVRKANDYVAEMIRLAGGKYIPEGLRDDASSASTMNLQMESFYSGAHDSDILIYNGTILDDVKSRKDLFKKDKLFADFKAVKNGRAFYVEKRLFQETTGLADFIVDLNKVMKDDFTGLVYLKELK